MRENKFKRLLAGTLSPDQSINMSSNIYQAPTIRDKAQQFIRKQSQERKTFTPNSKDNVNNKAALNNKI